MAEKDKKINLDDIVESISPEIVYEKIKGHDVARNEYKLDKLRIKNYTEFREELIKYMKHHHKKVFKTEIDDDRAFSMAHDMLEAIFRKEGGFEAAYKHAKKEGLMSIIDSLYNAEKNTHKQQYIKSKLKQFDPEDYDSRVEVIKKVMDSYKSFLPKDVKAKKPEYFAERYESFIQQYAEQVESARETFGTKKKKQPN